jgi:hypothetical protein
MPDWVPYETNNPAPMEVSIDMDFADDAAFRSSHPYRIALSATGFPADAQGQPTDEAADALYEMEESIDSFCAGRDAAMVCTTSAASVYRIYAYAADAQTAVDLREHLAGQQPSVEVQAERDDQWQIYTRYALAGEILEEARDRDQIQQMSDAGEDLSIPWLVTFDATVEEASYDGARQALANAGFNIDNEYIDTTVAGTVSVVVTAKNIKEARTAFMNVLAPFGGQYEGWGAEEPDEGAELEPH